MQCKFNLQDCFIATGIEIEVFKIISPYVIIYFLSYVFIQLLSKHREYS